MKSKLPIAIGVALATLSAPAIAQDKKFYLQAGIAQVNLQNSFSDFTIGGAADPTADASVSEPRTLLVTSGYMFRENWSVGFTGGLPVKSTATGQGSLAALGELGEIKFGVAGLHINRHFKVTEKFQPFVGLGLAYGIIFDTADGALTDVDVGNEFGPEIRVGFDYMMNDKYGAYFAVSKAFLEFDIQGMAGPAPASVKAKLDPLAIQAGITMRF